MTAKIEISPLAWPGVGWMAICLSGCVATRHEPESVAEPQPPSITASETVAGSGEVPLHQPPDRTAGEVRSQHAAAQPPLDFGQRVDRFHDQVYAWAQGVVESTDQRYAAKDKEPMPVPAAPFRMGVTLDTIDRDDGLDLDLDLDFDIRLSLPNIEQRLSIFITSDELDESPRAAEDDSQLRAGLRYEFLRIFDFDIGVKLDVPPVAFMSLKWSGEYQLGNWDFYPLAKLFAETDEGVGYSAAATFDRWSGPHLLRSSSYGKWNSDRDNIEWTQSFTYARVKQQLMHSHYGSYLRARDIGEGWGTRLLISGEDASYVDYYEAGVFYRRPTSNRWLYWSVEPLARWDRDYQWDTDPGIRIGFDMLFWDLARPAR